MKRGDVVQLGGVSCIVLDRALERGTWWVSRPFGQGAVLVRVVRGSSGQRVQAA